jgi:ribosomal protein S18 acetylase RimI-like enzyme
MKPEKAPAICAADITDIPALVQLVNSAYRGPAAKKGWTHEAHLIRGGARTDEAALREMMEKPGALLLKYHLPNRTLAGCVYLQVQETQLYLGMLTVHPEIQAQGIGKQLLFMAENYAARKGLPAVVMKVISVRTELINWYIRHGYSLTGKTEPFPENTRFGKPVGDLQFAILEKKL